MFDVILHCLYLCGLSEDVNLKCLIMKTMDKLIPDVQWREVVLVARTGELMILDVQGSHFHVVKWHMSQNFKVHEFMLKSFEQKCRWGGDPGQG